MGVRLFSILTIWILIILHSCHHKANDFSIILEAQGDYHAFLTIDSLLYNLYYTKYSTDHKIQDTIFRKIQIKRGQVQEVFSCHQDSLFTSPTFALFPFSLKTQNPTFTFVKRDTFENNVFHIYQSDYSCIPDHSIQHLLYCSYLNDQIRSHLLKIDNIYYRIDVITWQKEGGVLLPLRNKIYLSDSLASRKVLKADLIYANINFK